MTNVEVPEYEVQEELTTRPGESVLLMVDMQRDFMHPDGTPAAPDPAASWLFGADLVHADGLHLR